MTTNCSKCNNCKDECQCIPTGVTTPNYCISDTPACPEPAPCTETFDSNCVIYTGQGNECIDINNGDTVQEIIDNIAEKLQSLICIGCVGLVSPVTNSVNVGLFPVLSWGPSLNATGYDVYLGADATLVNNQDPSVLVSSNQVITSYTVTTQLSASTAYYWKVVPRNSGGTAEGCLSYRFDTTADECINPVEYILEELLKTSCNYDLSETIKVLDNAPANCLQKIVLTVNTIEYTYNVSTPYFDIVNYVNFLNTQGIGNVQLFNSTSITIEGNEYYTTMVFYFNPDCPLEIIGNTIIIDPKCTGTEDIIKNIGETLSNGIFISAASCDYCCPDCETTNRYILSGLTEDYFSFMQSFYNGQNYCLAPCCLNVQASVKGYTELLSLFVGPTSPENVPVENGINIPFPANCPCGTDFQDCVNSLKTLFPTFWNDIINLGIVEESTIANTTTLCIVKNLLSNFQGLTEENRLDLLTAILQAGIVVQCTEQGMLITSIKGYNEYIKAISKTQDSPCDCVNVTFTNTLPKESGTNITITYIDCQYGYIEDVIAPEQSAYVCVVNNSWSTDPNIDVVVEGSCDGPPVSQCVSITFSLNGEVDGADIQYEPCNGGDIATVILNSFHNPSATVCAVNGSWDIVFGVDYVANGNCVSEKA